MRASSRRNRAFSADYWPGFVDALATLLLVLVFLLSIFVLAQFYFGQALSGRDKALAQLNARIVELSVLLNLEESKANEFESSVAALRASLADFTDREAVTKNEINQLQGYVNTLKADKNAASTEIAGLNASLDDERKLSAQAQAQITLLNEQLAALRLQMASLQEVLDASDVRDAENKAVIVDLGKRLNTALAQKVQELAQYRSEFFGRLRKVLGDRADIEIVGDRFILQSEVLFTSGSAALSPSGQLELIKIASVLQEIATTIPGEVNWVLRIDGHSDRIPINTPEFPSNWYLSSARAIAVVTYLTDQGVPENRLVAAGFGEFHPLDLGGDANALRRNRRIEFKLTER